MLRKLLPREETFFDVFEQAADNVHEGAKALLDLVENYTDVPAKTNRIKDLEHKGDSLTHQTIERLNKTFITPIDREDIHRIATRLDDVLDLIDTAVDRMALYKIAKPIDDVVAIARALVRGTELIARAMREVRDLRNTARIQERCVDIHTVENDADKIASHALAALFENNMSPLDVIKWKDIIEDLEAATDRCEDVANTLEAVMLKQA
jgi:predicted phosphate transport protein (TIGR00153 family)